MPSAQVAWLAEQLRLTVFPVVGQEIDAAATFTAAAGKEADEIHSKREAGQQVLSSSRDGRLLRLVIQPDRIHWYLTVSPEVQQATLGFSMLGEYALEVAQFREFATSWLEGEAAPEIRRLGYGAVLLKPVQSQVEGYEFVKELVPSLDLDPSATSDLLYQVNKWRDLMAGVPGSRANRLSKWSVMLLQTSELAISPTGIQPIERGRFHAARLELDINTAQERTDPLPPRSLTPILDELMALGEEIALRGDTH